MHSVIVFIGFCLIGKSHEKFELGEVKTLTFNDTSCLNMALKTYYEYNRKVLFVSAPPNNIHKAMVQIPHFLTDKWNALDTVVGFVPGTAVIFLEGNADRDLKNLKRLRGTAFIRSILVLCVTDVVCGSKIYLKRITHIKINVWLYYIAMDQDRLIYLYEYTKYAEGRCGKAQLLKLARCSDKTITHKTFRPKMNFHKCPARLVSWHCPPHSVSCTPGSSQKLCGIEGQIINSFLQDMNATPVLTMVETPQEIRSRLVSGQADLGYGILDIRFYEGIQYSWPYMFVEGTVVAPHSVLAEKRSLTNLLVPFEPQVWLGLGLVATLALISNQIFPRLQRTPVLKLFGMLIGTSVPLQPRRCANRIFFITLVLFGFNLMQFYLANLTEVFAVPRQLKIRTLHDLDLLEIQIVGSPAYKFRFKDEYPRIYKNFKEVDFPTYYEELYELISGNLSSVFYVENTEKTIARWKNVESINDRISWYPVVAATPNSGALIYSMNKVIMEIMGNGIINEYENMYYSSTKSEKIYNPNSTHGQAAKITYNDLYGTFILLAIGSAISTAVLLVEVTVAFAKRKLTTTRGGGCRTRPFWPLAQRHVLDIPRPLRHYD